jgi:hypothetical protein
MKTLFFFILELFGIKTHGAETSNHNPLTQPLAASYPLVLLEKPAPVKTATLKSGEAAPSESQLRYIGNLGRPNRDVPVNKVTTTEIASNKTPERLFDPVFRDSKVRVTKWKNGTPRKVRLTSPRSGQMRTFKVVAVNGHELLLRRSHHRFGRIITRPLSSVEMN